MLGCFGIAQTVLAQSGMGKLTGKISDASNNETLNGVSVSVKGVKRGTSTIPDGSYILALPSGTYTLRYSYTGYQVKEITGVSIKAGETNFLDVLLQTNTQQMAGVVVTASVKKETAASVYSMQKRSAAASDGISLEAIRKTPDNNAGQILKRVTGVNVQDNRFIVVRGLNDQYNQTMLNGVPMTSTETNRNAFAFDLIPAAIIDNITINKTATPDMPGNFAGGIVQINTKDFPAKDFYSVLIGAGFSDQTLGKDFYADKRGKFDILAFGGNSRDLPKGFPTNASRIPIVYMNIQEQTRYLKMLNNNLPPVNHGPSRPNENFQFGFGKTIKLRNDHQLGIVAAVSQRKTELIEQETTAREPIFSEQTIPDTLQGLGYYSENLRYRYSSDFGAVANIAYRFGNNKIFLKSLYTRVFNNQFIFRPTLFIESFQTAGAAPLEGYSYLVEQKSIFNTILGGEHRTGNNNETRLDWNVNVTANNTQFPDTRNFLFARDTVSSILQNNGNASYRDALAGGSRLWSGSNDLIYGGAFNVTSPFTFFYKHLFKAGMLFQNRHRTVTGTGIPLTRLYGKLSDVLAPESFSPEDAQVSTISAAQVTSSSNYLASTGLLAAYESIENKIGKKLRVIWGARLENYQQSLNVYTPTYINDFEEPLPLINQAGARTTFNFLPSLNVVYSPVSSINVRAAYSNTVIRPELRDIAAFVRYDLQTFSLNQGNKYLKSSTIKNYDLKFEWFPSAGEIISASLYYKQIKDPIEYARGPAGTDNEIFRTPVNAGDAYVKGIEAELRKKIDFIAALPWLSHVTLFGNGSILRSDVKRKDIKNEFFDYVGEHKLTGQPDYIINAGASILLFHNTFEATGSFNRTGDYISELGSSDFTRSLADGTLIQKVPNYRVRSRNLVDLVLSQALFNDKLRIKFNVSNLLKEQYILYQDLNNNNKYDTPVTIDKTKLEKNYKDGIDNTPFIIKPQRTYSLSFAYTF
ncbi:MAG: TonB-dependent receptor [Chitinophagaceae bacterium]|nr:TonB-dependent receptor [Chitinophagaceae bacterium]